MLILTCDAGAAPLRAASAPQHCLYYHDFKTEMKVGTVFTISQSYKPTEPK